MNQYEEDKVIMISEWPVIEQEAQLPGIRQCCPTYILKYAEMAVCFFSTVPSKNFLSL